MRIAVSGGFDPLHIGHLRYIQEAAKLGQVVVILNGDSFLMRKKGFVFMASPERAEILLGLKGVSEVYVYDSERDDVSEALETVEADVFAKGGDRTGPENITEWDWCMQHGIEVLTGVGGGKIQSSQWLTKGRT
jgi:D-beta-D-heptose 7-phosphate kinase/D-beta-D-heptose 1-phosphate adenosyltransferase